MKKNFKFYIIAWAILLAVFNLTAFFVRAVLPGFVFLYDARFWVAWGVTIAAFFGQLACAALAFNAKNKEKFFLKLPLITGSYSSLITMMVVCSILMIIPDCPAWIAVIVCAITLGFSAISILKAAAAAEIVSAVEDKVKAQTAFIRLLTADAASLAARAQDDAAKAATKKVYEAIRYSDPMSHPALAGVEQQISTKFAELSEAMDAGNAELVAKCAERLVQLVAERNNKCMVLK